MSIKLRPDDTGNDDGYIQFNYLIKLGEFTLDAPPGTKCTVRIDVGYQVQITDGSGLDNMIATLLVIDKKMWDSSPSPKNYAWVPQKVTINNKDVNNTVAFTTDTNNMFNLLKWDGVVKAGVVSESTVIKDSKLPKITRDGKLHDVTLNGDVKLPSGLYYVVGYLGIATNDTILIQKRQMNTNTVTFTGACDLA